MHPASAALSALSKAFEELFSQPNLKPLSSPPEDFALLIDPYSKWVQQAEVSNANIAEENLFLLSVLISFSEYFGKAKNTFAVFYAKE